MPIRFRKPAVPTLIRSIQYHRLSAAMICPLKARPPDRSDQGDKSLSAGHTHLCQSLLIFAGGDVEDFGPGFLHG
jgi:hypothetical protein